ncbi:hypothetical protein K4K49_009358 [Colletotrichum sp. SAR 10_70]|nr:hypothetical protein K4K50_011406 [Colletotrichum sp. SAR 10_71]KAI8155306.1 hypothetical protein K4K49_009358 [Colletotrichum sp. SAR 10_70]
MNTSLVLPARSLLGLGLRATCRRAATSSSPLRLLSTFSAPRVTRSPWPPIHRNLWPSPAARATQPRYASSSSSSAKSTIIREYEDLPADYRDKTGLPFRDKDLTAAEVKAVFGPAIKPNAANRLLRILHGRRVAGTLDDPIFTVNTASFRPEQRAAALEYLRDNVPVDEILNAGLRAEDELAQLEKEIAEQADGDAAADADSPKTSLRNNDKDNAPEEVKPDPVYGYSVMDAIRAKNQAKAREEEARLAREAAEKGLPPPVPGGAVATVPIKRPPMSPRMQKWQEQGQITSNLDAPPELTLFERLLPSYAVVALLVGALAAAAMVYSPPHDTERLYPEVSASTATVGFLIGLNALVYAAWHVPPLWGFLNRYFIMVHGMPRAVTMLTANFSHASLSHLATNMVGLWFVGTALHDEIGRANFLAIYMASGALGLLGSLTIYTLRGILTVSTVGASGAVFGTATAYFWMHRFDTFKILGFPPDPMNGPQGLGFLAVLLGVHIAALFRRGKQTVDLTSHLCGMLAGLIGIELVTGRKEVPKAREDLVKDAPPREDGDEDVKA